MYWNTNIMMCVLVVIYLMCILIMWTKDRRRLWPVASSHSGGGGGTGPGWVVPYSNSRRGFVCLALCCQAQARKQEPGRSERRGTRGAEGGGETWLSLLLDSKVLWYSGTLVLWGMDIIAVWLILDPGVVSSLNVAQTVLRPLSVG